MSSNENWLKHKTNAIRPSVSDEIRQVRIILFCNAQVSKKLKSKKPTLINTLRLKLRQLEFKSKLTGNLLILKY